MFVPLQESVPVVDPSAASGVLSLLWVIIALPALGATVILLLGNSRTSRWAHWLGCGTLIGSFVLSLVSFLTILGRPVGRPAGLPAAVDLGPGRRPSRWTSGCSSTRCPRCSCC